MPEGRKTWTSAGCQSGPRLRCLAAAALVSSLLPIVASAASCEGAEQQLSAANEALDQGDIESAERLFSAVLTAHPGCSEVWLGLGRARVAGGDRQTALKWLSRYVEAVPDSSKGLSYLAEALLGEGDYRRADSLSERALKLDAGNPLALLLRGRILAMKGMPREAEELLEKASRLAPNDPEPYFQLGTLYDANQEHRKAVAQFQKVISMTTKNPRAYDFLALNLEPLGRLEEAEQSYRKGLRVNQGPLFDGFLDYNYGRFLMKQNRLEEALQHLDRAVEIAAGARAVHFERAKLNLKLGRRSEARRDAEKALALPDPGDVILDLQVYYLLATIYTRLGEKELAQKYVRLSQSTKVPAKARSTRSRGR